MDPVAEPTEQHAGEQEPGWPSGAEQALRAAIDPRTAPLHLGLDSTAERLRLSGGDLEIESEPGAGTVVGMAIPLDSV